MHGVLSLAGTTVRFSQHGHARPLRITRTALPLGVCHSLTHSCAKALHLVQWIRCQGPSYYVRSRLSYLRCGALQSYFRSHSTLRDNMGRTDVCSFVRPAVSPSGRSKALYSWSSGYAGSTSPEILDCDCYFFAAERYDQTQRCNRSYTRILPKGNIDRTCIRSPSGQRYSSTAATQREQDPT